MKREKLKPEHFVTTGMIEEKQHEKILDGLKKRLKAGRVTDALKATRDRDAWKVIVSYAREHDT